MNEIIMLSKIVLMPADWANITRVAKLRNVPRTIVNRLLLPHNTIDIDLLQLSEQNMFFISRWDKIYSAAIMAASRQLAPMFVRFPAALTLLTAKQRAFLYIPWFSSLPINEEYRQPDLVMLEQYACTLLIKAMHNRFPPPLVPLLALFFSDECQEPDIRDDQIYSEEYFLFLQALEYA
ncbi:hypothetical protein I5520_11220 [Citrobacter sp. FDAARGOS_156]|uniref:hypothetical protein n=1 Tax=unclassified Citrobacter TaxID=2644389 RepID=UPI0010C98AC2|nr:MULTISPECIES: hypothetical protein [unclassified Citrobacter]MBJ9111526.1 hypothetical protein [Citrobacter sp. FDAARGOS_156]MBJ9642552.1 hypothetical protein [Citrobacter sp. FDAARGOS_156]TKU43890.1 hypothetical protein FDX24_04820 [Citrobacter sp. wls716]